MLPKSAKMTDWNGGCSRARTYDPLIKSHWFVQQNQQRFPLFGICSGYPKSLDAKEPRFCLGNFRVRSTSLFIELLNRHFPWCAQRSRPFRSNDGERRRLASNPLCPANELTAKSYGHPGGPFISPAETSRRAPTAPSSIDRSMFRPCTPVLGQVSRLSPRTGEAPLATPHLVHLGGQTQR